MPIFEVEFSQRMSVMVTVEAETAVAAGEAVSRYSFELPPREQWTANKDGYIRVFDQNGAEAHEIEF